MEDHQIIELYFARSEQAIAATAGKFGPYCYSIAYNILHDRLDSEECVSDTYMDTWNAIPPHRPNSLSAFVGRITRRNALDRWDYLRAEKRGGGEVSLALEELSVCVSNKGNPEAELASRELGRIISLFVRQLPEPDRYVFIRRYWYLEPVKEIATKYGYSVSKVKSMLHRTRIRLRDHLEREGIMV